MLIHLRLRPSLLPRAHTREKTETTSSKYINTIYISHTTYVHTHLVANQLTTPRSLHRAHYVATFHSHRKLHRAPHSHLQMPNGPHKWKEHRSLIIITHITGRYLHYVNSIALTQATTQSATLTQMPNESHRCHSICCMYATKHTETMSV